MNKLLHQPHNRASQRVMDLGNFVKFLCITAILCFFLERNVFCQVPQDANDSIPVKHPERQLEDEDEEATTPAIPHVTRPPDQFYANLNMALNLTTGVFQDILCRVPFFRLCAGGSGIKFVNFPIPPPTLPTTSSKPIIAGVTATPIV